MTDLEDLPGYDKLLKPIFDHVEKTGGFYWHGKWKGVGKKPDIECSCPKCKKERKGVSGAD